MSGGHIVRGVAFSHPDDEYREDLLGEAAYYALLAETLEPLWIAPGPFSELSTRTIETVRAEQFYALNAGLVE